MTYETNLPWIDFDVTISYESCDKRFNVLKSFYYLQSFDLILNPGSAGAKPGDEC